MKTTAQEPGQNGPLSREQILQVVEADRQQAKFLLAARVAGFNGWTMAGCAVLCVPFAFFNPWTLLVAAALGAAAYFELDGRAKLRALDPGGARALAINQVAVLLGVYVYCGLNLYMTLSGPSISTQFQQDPALAAALGAASDPELDDMLGGMDELVQAITVIVYVALAGLSTIFQGGMAVFYEFRRRALVAYLASTPAWILELQRQRW